MPDDPNLLWEKGRVNAHLWAEKLAPNSDFAVEWFGTQHAKDDPVATVSVTVTLNAANAYEAESAVRLLLDQAMPAVTFSQILPRQITGRHVAAPHSEPLCSFCGKTRRQVRSLIAGPGVYICDECVEMMAEIIQEELPPSDA